MKRGLLTFVLFLMVYLLSAQKPVTFQFALVTDTHIGTANSETDLRRTVSDINLNDSLSFVIISGDITEFGSDKELLLAKQILDSLNKPWHIIPGNHDTKWSESGGNSFRKVFGSETFSFVFGHFLFVGTNSGPNMRMSPGQIPRENIVWLDSLLKSHNDNLHIIFVNHYPLNNSVNNWYEAIDRLKKRDVQAILCGHGHVNQEFSFEDIPGLMGRSNLSTKKCPCGYNIIHIKGDSLLTASERTSEITSLQPWCRIKLLNHHFEKDKSTWPRPDFSMNRSWPMVKEAWMIKEKSDIGAGIVLSGKNLIVTNTKGEIKSYGITDCKLNWQFNTSAKIYSTPALSGNTLLESVTNGKVYALNVLTGRLLWKFDAGEPIVASPVIFEDQAFISGSGSKCFSLALKDGSIKWNNNEIIGFVETIPAIYNDMIIFGTWENRLYALDKKTGGLVWLWHNATGNRMLSPAACVPVVVNDRVFVVSPDRKMTCLNAETGKIIWQSSLKDSNVRESMGLSADRSMIYAKTMDGNVIGVSTTEPDGKIVWRADLNTGYDISPSVIVESEGTVFIPTDKGLIYAADRATGKLLWEHRISSCLINKILPLDKHSVICTSMDGVITKLVF